MITDATEDTMTLATPPDLRAALDTQLAAALQRFEVPGAAVGIVNGDAEYLSCAGVTSVANPLPVDADTLFQIGSTTKTLTATAVMRLVEQGRLDLDTPVRTWLPSLRLQVEDVAARVTLRHLLTHTAGWEGDVFDDTGAGDDALARKVELMADLPQLTPLGAVWSYNNAGFCLAGRVIEAVTGDTYEKALHDLVLAPIGMPDSLFTPEDVLLRRFTVGHVHTRDGVVIARPWRIGRSTNPAGGLVSSIRDQLTYARFVLDGGRATGGTQLVQPETMQLMQSEQAAAGSLADFVGLSWLLQDVGGVRVVKHGGNTNGQTSAFLTVPSRRFAIAVSTNADRGGALCGELVDWALREHLGIAAAEPATVDLTAAAAAEYTGTYEARLARSELTFVEGGIEVRTAPQNLPRDADIVGEAPPPVRIRCVAADRFVVSGRAGMTVEFIRGDDGAVEWARLGGRLARRVASRP